MVKKNNKKCSSKSETTDLVDLSEEINKKIKNTIQAEELEEIDKDKFANKYLLKCFNNEEYVKKFQRYITEQFNSKCINLLNSFIHLPQTSFPGTLKNLIKIVRYFMMNEYEITLFTLYIDKFKWDNQDESFEFNHLFFLGFHTKKHCNNFKEYEEMGFIDEDSQYNEWTKKFIDDKGQVYNLVDVNQMYQKLNKPLTVGLKKNYIDYNNVVEKIIHLSNKNPDEEKGNGKIVKETQILDNIKEPSFQNEKPFSSKNPRITKNDSISNINMNKNFLLNPNDFPDGKMQNKNLHSFLSMSSKNEEPDGKYSNEYGAMIEQGMSRTDQKIFGDGNLYAKKESSFFGQNDINMEGMSSGYSQQFIDYGYNQNLNKSKTIYDSNN